MDLPSYKSNRVTWLFIAQRLILTWGRIGGIIANDERIVLFPVHLTGQLDC